MKLVKIFILFVVILFTLVFLMQNTGLVSVNLIFKQYENVSVALVMLLTLGIGILIGYISAVGLLLGAKAEIRALNIKNHRVINELNDLRNVAIEEGINIAEEMEDE